MTTRNVLGFISFPYFVLNFQWIGAFPTSSASKDFLPRRKTARDDGPLSLCRYCKIYSRSKKNRLAVVVVNGFIMRPVYFGR